MFNVGIEIGDALRTRPTGMARYAQNLLTALSAQVADATVRPWAPRRRMLGVLKSPELFPVRFFDARKPYFAPGLFHATACVFPKWKSPVEIVTVHDLIAVRAELNPTIDQIRERTAYIRRADKIVCVSRHTRMQLHSALDLPEHRTIAIPLAAAPEFKPAASEAQYRLRRRHGLPTEFLLFVGRYRWNKNLERLLQAYAQSGLRLPLFFAGRFNKYEQANLMQVALAAGCADSIGWLRAVQERELPVLMSAASALCMPSTFEGFGLPIVEALACGTPVLTSAGRATEETAGGHATLVDPESVESIAQGLHAVLATSHAQRLEGRAYAARRTWRDVAAETWQVYRDAYREVGLEPLHIPEDLEVESSSR